jgi:hypothetical protein
MSDTYYGLECLARARARAVDLEIQRRRRLAQARGRNRRPPIAGRMMVLGQGLLRIGRWVVGRGAGAAGHGGIQAGRR